MRYGFKNAEEVKETSLKYNLHSWSVQGKLNPAVVEKAEGIYYLHRRRQENGRYVKPAG